MPIQQTKVICQDSILRIAMLILWTSPLHSDVFNSGFQETTVQSVHEALQKSDAETLLLDVRTPSEYRSGHAPTAINIELDALSEAVKAGTLDDWKEHGPVMVICQSGKRSAQAAVRLSRVFSFSKVVNVAGGTSAWIAAGFPVEQGEGSTLDAPPHLQP